MEKLTYVMITCLFGILASPSHAAELNSSEAAHQARVENLKMPEPYSDGRVQTLNNMGAMSPDLDLASLCFVEASKIPQAKLLEIGPGYGLACQKALEAGCQDYTAMDMDDRHLKILAHNLEKLNPDFLSKLTLISGAFPQDRAFVSSTYDALLMARVLHYMKPDQIWPALVMAFDLLKPGGIFCAIVLTPFVRGFAPFIPIYEKRRLGGEEYPGYVENLQDYTDRDVVPQKVYDNLNSHFLFLDRNFAQGLFEKAGFIVDRCEEVSLAYPSDMWQLDGRENLIIIARKPA